MKITELVEQGLIAHDHWLTKATVEHEGVTIVAGEVVWHGGTWHGGEWYGGSWLGGQWLGGYQIGIGYTGAAPNITGAAKKELSAEDLYNWPIKRNKHE